MPPVVVLDVNPVIRLLTRDHPDHAARARALFERAGRREMERLRIPTIASFDRDFDRFPQITRLEP
jgi:predicted nucleic acid-binding protein